MTHIRVREKGENEKEEEEEEEESSVYPTTGISSIQMDKAPLFMHSNTF